MRLAPGGSSDHEIGWCRGRSTASRLSLSNLSRGFKSDNETNRRLDGLRFRPKITSKIGAGYLIQGCGDFFACVCGGLITNDEIRTDRLVARSAHKEERSRAYAYTRPD